MMPVRVAGLMLVFVSEERTRYLRHDSGSAPSSFAAHCREDRRALEIAWDEAGGVGSHSKADPHLIGQDRISNPCKRMRQQAAADEAGGAARYLSWCRAKAIWQPKSQLISQQTPGMRQVILASDSAHDPVGESTAISVRYADRPQYADVQRIELRESYRSDARCNVGLDDTKRIVAIVERSHVHGHVRPRRSCDALDESSDA